MTTLRGFLIVLGAAGGLALAATGASASESVRDLGDGRALVVKFSGKPPFSRRIVAIENLSARQLERLASGPVTASRAPRLRGLRSSSVSTKPPFRPRSTLDRVESDVEFARFEEDGADDEASVGRGAPGKSLPFRRRPASR